MTDKNPEVHEAVAVYAPETVETDRVPSGYRQTEVGVIPEDWEVTTLGEIGDCLIGLTYTPSNVKPDGLLVLRSSNVGSGGLRFEDNVFVDVDVPEKLLVRNDDILICVRNGSRSLVGKSALIDERARGMTFGAFMSVFRSPQNRFVFYQFQSEIVKRQIHARLGATINQITNASLNSFQIPFPGEQEQRAIAAALSDVDALISGLDKLIAKKRAVKTAAMQQLLTGKQRLPGFSGEWEVKRFGEITSPRRERIDPRKSGPQTFCVELEHVDSGTGRLLGSTSTGNQSSLKSVFQAGDVLFGKLRSYLRKYWLADRSGVCSTEFWVLSANNQAIISEFLFQVVSTDQFVEAASTAYGTHMPRADWNVVKNYEVPMPSVEEQTAIAAVLSDMDEEVAALEEQREKTRRIKQGMMQELLTGWTRLV